MKRFQECNKIEKIWRYRWYLTLPFCWLWRQYFNPLKIYMDEEVDGKLVHTDKYYHEKGKNLWKLLVGGVQFKMNWTYTHKEVMDRLKKRFDS